MRNRKLLYVLIPLIIVVLILIAGVVFLKISSSPKSIFKTAVDRVFNTFESAEEQYSTMKGTINLSVGVESENEQMQAINAMLDGTSINLDMQADIDNMIVNENLNITVNNESLLDAAIILQDQKGYIYLKDYLDKYLEIPQENMEYLDLTEYYDKMATLDQKALMEAIKVELIEAISSKEFTQVKIEKIKVSTLDLTQEEFSLLSKKVLENLKQNQDFNNALGECKDDALVVIDDMIEDYEDLEYDEDSRITISIFTEGLLNKFTGFAVELSDSEDIVLGMVLAMGKQNSEFSIYEQYNGEKEELLKVRVEDTKDSKNKGTATITMTVDEEQFVATYNYEKQGKQTSFVLSTEIEGVILSFSGNATEDGKNVKGNFMISVQEETLGKANLNCAYDFTYGVQIEKLDTRECSID